MHKKSMVEAKKTKEPSALEVIEKIKHTIDSKRREEAIMKFHEKGGDLDRLNLQLALHLRLPLGDVTRDRLITASDFISKIKENK